MLGNLPPRNWRACTPQRLLGIGDDYLSSRFEALALVADGACE